MYLISSVFIIFIFLFFFLYFLLPKKVQPVVLLIFSIIFLFYNNFSIPILLEVLLVLITSYISGVLIEKKKNKFLCALVGVLIILLELIILKYSNLFISIANFIISVFSNYRISNVSIASPLGFSYFSLIMISYIIDVYRGTVKAEKNILKLAVFMNYFPILSSGPFIRYDECKDDMFHEHRFDVKKFFDGIFRIVIGLFKVFVISYRINIIVTSVYGSLSQFNGFIIFGTSLLYTLELYTNFSGCIDIVLGISHIIGVDLPENFNNPFCSKSVTELWRRWHITLGKWLKDYIFFPVLKSNHIQRIMIKSRNIFGKKWGKKLTTYYAMLILWILIGVWHGGEYKFIISSGIIQLVYMIIEDAFEPVFIKRNELLHINNESKIYKFYQCVKTFILFSLAMVFFRATSVSNGFEILSCMFKFNVINNFSLININLMDIIVLFISLLMLFIYDGFKEKIIDKYKSFNYEKKTIVILTIVLVIIVFGIYGIGFNYNEFIYSKF